MMANIIFMGTPDFAVPALEALQREFGVRAVVTVPDKPQGRGRQVQPSAVKSAALELGIDTILQPAKLRDPDFISALESLQPDIICVIAFRILPKQVYSLARLGSFNVHASLLPKYRGAAPINHAIINGEQETGVTSFLLNDVVDTGTILLQERLGIADGTTAGELYTSLKPLAAQCAVDTCRLLLDGTARPLPQDDDLATPAPKVFRETARVDWAQPRSTVRNFILGHSPSPCAWTELDGQVVKIYHASLSDVPCPTSTYLITDNSIIVGCADGSISLDEVQFPGKRRMRASEVIPGYRGSREGNMQ